MTQKTHRAPNRDGSSPTIKLSACYASTQGPWPDDYLPDASNEKQKKAVALFIAVSQEIANRLMQNTIYPGRDHLRDQLVIIAVNHVNGDLREIKKSLAESAEDNAKWLENSTLWKDRKPQRPNSDASDDMVDALIQCYRTRTKTRPRSINAALNSVLPSI